MMLDRLNRNWRYFCYWFTCVVMEFALFVIVASISAQKMLVYLDFDRHLEHTGVFLMFGWLDHI